MITSFSINMLSFIFQVLKNGVVLCKLMNKISPGAIPKFKEKGMPFILMENIQAFLVSNLEHFCIKDSILYFYKLNKSNIVPLITSLFFLFFQKAAKVYGVPDAEVFQTPDLFEARNIPQVKYWENRVKLFNE